MFCIIEFRRKIRDVSTHIESTFQGLFEFWQGNLFRLHYYGSLPSASGQGLYQAHYKLCGTLTECCSESLQSLSASYGPSRRVWSVRVATWAFACHSDAPALEESIKRLLILTRLVNRDSIRVPPRVKLRGDRALSRGGPDICCLGRRK